MERWYPCVSDMQTTRVHAEGSNSSPVLVGGLAKTSWGRIRLHASVGSLTGRIGWQGGVEIGPACSKDAAGEDEAERLSLLGNELAVVVGSATPSSLSLSLSEKEDDDQNFDMMLIS